MNRTYKWGNKYLTGLTTQHLKNIIPWIKRNNLKAIKKLEDSYTPYCIKQLEKVINSRIDCIQAELNFRAEKEDKRIEFGIKNREAEKFLIEFKKDEKQFRLGNWKTREEFIREEINNMPDEFIQECGWI